MDDDLFIDGIQTANETYNACRDNSGPYETQLRSFMRGLWREYRPFADSNFRQHMLVDLDARFWEMYLACTLLENSLPLLRSKEGPDISIKHHVGRIWVEAIAPTGGADSNPDRVPNMKPGIATLIPEEKIILRLRAAIREKYDSKYHDYVKKGLVKPTDPYVIGINSCRIRSWRQIPLVSSRPFSQSGTGKSRLTGKPVLLSIRAIRFGLRLHELEERRSAQTFF